LVIDGLPFLLLPARIIAREPAEVGQDWLRPMDAATGLPCFLSLSGDKRPNLLAVNGLRDAPRFCSIQDD
jgi:hypothetical protein